MHKIDLVMMRAVFEEEKISSAFEQAAALYNIERYPDTGDEECVMITWVAKSQEDMLDFMNELNLRGVTHIICDDKKIVEVIDG